MKSRNSVRFDGFFVQQKNLFFFLIWKFNEAENLTGSFTYLPDHGKAPMVSFNWISMFLLSIHIYFIIMRSGGWTWGAFAEARNRWAKNVKGIHQKDTPKKKPGEFYGNKRSCYLFLLIAKSNIVAIVADVETNITWSFSNIASPYRKIKKANKRMGEQMEKWRLKRD